MTYKQGTHVRTIYGYGKVVTEATDMHGYGVQYSHDTWGLLKKKKVIGEVFHRHTLAFNISEDEIMGVDRWWLVRKIISWF